MAETKEVKIGVRISVPPTKAGISLFGTDEVNEMISKGWRVVSIQPGGVILSKTGEQTAGTVSMVLSGCEMRVVLSPPQ